jgi:hypothetical protein
MQPNPEFLQAWKETFPDPTAPIVVVRPLACVAHTRENWENWEKRHATFAGFAKEKQPLLSNSTQLQVRQGVHDHL